MDRYEPNAFNAVICSTSISCADVPMCPCAPGSTVRRPMNPIAEQQGIALGILRDCVTVLETKHETVAIVVNELKGDIKSLQSEINDRFDAATKATQSQFEKMFTVIRELSQPPK